MVMPHRVNDAEHVGHQNRGQLGGERRGADGRLKCRERDLQRPVGEVGDKHMLALRVNRLWSGQPTKTAAEEGVARVDNNDLFGAVTA